MRWFALAAVLLLAGCIRPFAADKDPDRESVPIPRGEFYGEPLSTNGTMRVSLVPGEVVAPVSEEPLNCFVIEDADDERQSFLGGVSIDLSWTATSAMTESLNVTVSSPAPYGGGSMTGTSPLHLVLVDPLDVDSSDTSYRTPLTVRVAPAGLAVAVPDQPVDWAAKVGILESAITGIRWRHCEVTDLPLPAPPVVPLARDDAVPRTSSVLAD